MGGFSRTVRYTIDASHASHDLHGPRQSKIWRRHCASGIERSSDNFFKAGTPQACGEDASSKRPFCSSSTHSQIPPRRLPRTGTPAWQRPPELQAVPFSNPWDGTSSKSYAWRDVESILDAGWATVIELGNHRRPCRRVFGTYFSFPWDAMPYTSSVTATSRCFRKTRRTRSRPLTASNRPTKTRRRGCVCAEAVSDSKGISAGAPGSP